MITSRTVIESLKSIFARHGVPVILRTDSRSQYMSKEFPDFTRIWGFQHITNSRRFSQSNGAVEAAVKIMKTILNKARDPYMSLLAHVTTPVDCRYSPSELLMGRKLRTNVPNLPRATDTQVA